MGKVNDIFTSDTIQNFSGCFMKCTPAAIMVRLKPHSLKESPYRLGDVEMRRIRWEVENVKASFLPLRDFACNFSFAMNRCIVKHHESRPVNPFGEIVQPFSEPDAGDGIRGVESFVFTVRGYDSEDVQPVLPFGWDRHILILELPSVRYIATGADMALISKIETDEACTPKIYKFLQLMAFELNKLRRGSFPWTFPYTFISCASNSKKRLKVESLTSLFESSCHAALAVFMLSRCFLTASFTFTVSDDVINGFGPREPFSCSAEMPSFSYRFTQLYTAIFPYPTMAAISSPFIPSALRRTPWQRIRYLWQDPNFSPFSSSVRCSAVRFNFFVFPIMWASCIFFRNITFVDEQIV